MRCADDRAPLLPRGRPLARAGARVLATQTGGAVVKSTLVVSFENALEEVASKRPEKFRNTYIWLWTDSDGLTVECQDKEVRVSGKRLMSTNGDRDKLIALANEVVSEIDK